MLSCSETLSGQIRPAWINHGHRKINFPNDQFYTGFTTQYFDSKVDDPNKVQLQLSDRSRTQLAESILISIQSNSISHLSKLNSTTVEKYNKQILTSTNLEITNLKTETFIDYKNKFAYGFSYVEKDVLLRAYMRTVDTELIMIEDGLKSVQKDDVDIEIIDRLEDQLKHITTKLNVLTSVDSDQLSQFRLRHNVLSNRLLSCKKKIILKTQTLEEFASSISLELNKYKYPHPIKLNLLTYKNTGIASELSHYFHHILKGAIGNSSKLSLTNSMIEAKDTVLELFGSYWIEREHIKIFVSYGLESQGLMISQNQTISANCIAPAQVRVAPPLPKSNNQIRKEDSILSMRKSPNEFKVSLSTTKGSDALVYWVGEKMKLRIYTNRPAYFRVINQWKDGRKALLVDNFKIEQSEINQIIELPFQWNTTCPCGVEYIYLYAQNEPFSSLNTSKYGHIDIIEGSAKEISQDTHPNSQKELQPTFVFAQDKLTITTYP